MSSDEGVPELTGVRTTFHDMFRDLAGQGPLVSSVEIPLIQRDYAQGREDDRTEAIRSTFLHALHEALTGKTSAGLDFIYGEVDRNGTFEPLDGQQRLTTLFLLHWYVAARRGDVSPAHSWTRFTYATRPSARRFCERVVENPPPPDQLGRPSAWITDQSWYLHLWSFDPSIRAMLVTLDAIAEKFGNEDPEALWIRLVDPDEPAVWFQLLPIDEMGQAEDLYIKMNSRGKPLTEFEAFKATLGQLVQDLDGPSDFGHRIDGVWTDLLWPYRGDNDIVDDEFMRYFDFVMEILEWREVADDAHGRTADARIRSLLDFGNPGCQANLAFILRAFDGWVSQQESPEEFFATLFSTDPDSLRIQLYGAGVRTDLLQSCCERYGDTSGTTRLYSLTDTLLLFATLLGQDLPRDVLRSRLRVLRNVNEASQFEMRLTNMPKLVSDVERFMASGDLDELQTHNANQVSEERRKRDLVEERPDLLDVIVRLENHNILRGTLASFDLESSLATRAMTFDRVFEPDRWPTVTGALLASGEYQRGFPNSDQFRFGSPTTDSVWRLVLVDRGDRDVLAPVRKALARLLDDVADSPDDVAVALETVSADFVTARESEKCFDWRYYLVKYPEMREGNSGIYYGADRRLGYEMTMLRRKVQSSYFRDPYLYAIWNRAGRPAEVEDPWFFGYSTTPRWMTTAGKEVRLRSIGPGFAVAAAPGAGGVDSGLRDFLATEGAVESDDGWLLAVSQEPVDGGSLVDSVDRVSLGAGFLGRLVAAGY
jgi:hypothetical protein